MTQVSPVLVIRLSTDFSNTLEINYMILTCSFPFWAASSSSGNKAWSKKTIFGFQQKKMERSKKEVVQDCLFIDVKRYSFVLNFFHINFPLFSGKCLRPSSKCLELCFHRKNDWARLHSVQCWKEVSSAQGGISTHKRLELFSSTIGTIDQFDSPTWSGCEQLAALGLLM